MNQPPPQTFEPPPHQTPPPPPPLPDACVRQDSARQKRKRALRSEACNALGASDGINHSRAVLSHKD